MTKKQFYNAITNGQGDILEKLAHILRDGQVPYCIIGGLAVNAYADPVISLDMDIVIAKDSIPKFVEIAQLLGFTCEPFEHSINLTEQQFDVRIQVQTDPRYEGFIMRAEERDVLGYNLYVASIEDVLRGKSWAYLDTSRRASKRQKDLTDIVRLLEVRPDLESSLPDQIQKSIRL